MKLTASKVIGYLYDRLRNSDLAGEISGTVYRNGMRPRDSRLEDAVIRFTAGLSNEVETGEVAILLYVPDLDPYANGCRVANGKRIAELETAASRWVEELDSAADGYLFSMADTIRSIEDEEIGQHHVVLHLQYKHYNY